MKKTRSKKSRDTVPLNSLLRIRDGKNKDPGRKKFGSGIIIPDPQHWLWLHCISRIFKLPQSHLIKKLYLKDGVSAEEPGITVPATQTVPEVWPVLPIVAGQSLLPSVADPWHFGVDPDPDPRIHASDLDPCLWLGSGSFCFINDHQDANKQLIVLKSFPAYYFLKVLLHQGFSCYICLKIDGSRRSKKMWIRNTAFALCVCCTAPGFLVLAY